MNLLSRLALVTFFVCLGFAAFYWSIVKQGRDEVDALLRDLSHESAARIETATAIQGAGLESLVSSYAWWDDMVKFMDAPDEDWASNNVDNIVGIPNGGDAIWVLDAELNVVHTIDKEYRRPPLPYPSSDALRRGIRDRFTFRYFALIDGSLWEIYGAAIQSASFWRHQAPVRGYLLLGRRWDEEWISRLNTIVGARITLQPLEPADATPPSAHAFHQTMLGLDGRPLVQLKARFNFEAIESTQQAFARSVIYITLGGVLAIVLIAGVVAFLVLRPLSWITRSLESRLPTHLTGLLNARTEFGEIARLVAGQLRWGRMLEEEMRRQLDRPVVQNPKSEHETNRALRMRLASNLHDGPIQTIYAAGLQLAAVQMAIEEGLPAPTEQLTAVNNLLQHALSDLRNLVLDMEPEDLHECDLETALVRLEGQMRQLTRCAVALTIAEGALDGLTREAQTHLYFICRELASNALRHARPSQITLRFSAAQRFLRIEWSNDGVRADQDTRASGQGLANIERRIAALDGTWICSSTVPDGWRMQAELPYSSLTFAKPLS